MYLSTEIYAFSSIFQFGCPIDGPKFGGPPCNGLKSHILMDVDHMQLVLRKSIQLHASHMYLSAAKINLEQYFNLGGPWVAEHLVGHPGMDFDLLYS